MFALVHLSRFHSTVKVTCMRTDYSQNTCQILKVQSQQHFMPFFLLLCGAGIAWPVGAPAPAPPVLLVAQEPDAQAWWSGLAIHSCGFLEGLILV